MKQILQNLKSGELEVAEVPGLKNIIRLIMTIGIFWAVDSCSAKSPEPAEGLHCATIELGQALDFEKAGKGLLANPKVWGAAGKDGSIAYRRLKPNSTAEVLFAAFDVDGEGFCKNDMILEIFYRDGIEAHHLSKYKVKGRVTVQSRIDFVKEREYAEVGYLSATGDEKWKLRRIFLERTPRQLLRAIDGSFQFKIVMPPESSRPLPVCSAGLISMEHQEFVRLREDNRAKRGLKRIDYRPAGRSGEPPEEWRKRGFVVYPANYLQLVFPDSTADCNLAGTELRCFEIPGRQEPVAFVIHALQDLSDVQITVSDLRCQADTIPADMISVRRVIYNDQRWGWEWEKGYGTCPDYLVPTEQNLNIKHGRNQPFWLTINVPENAKPGLYNGSVAIFVEQKQMYSIPLSVEVLNVKLLKNKVKHMVYHSPYFKTFHRDPTGVLQDMKSHGLVPVFYPKGRLITTPAGRLTVRLDDFEYELQQFRKIYPLADTIFVGLFNYGSVWTRLNGPAPAYQRAFPQFESAYGRILAEYVNVAKKYGIEPAFSFTDEPNLDRNNRRISYLCSRIARQNGFRTWCAYLPYTDVQLPLTPQERRENINYLRPLSEVLDILLSGIWAVDDTAVDKYGKRNLAYYTTFAGTSIRPVYNRFLHGLFPFVTGSNYVVCYAYSDSIGDGYDDLDCLKSQKKTVGLNDFLLTYPSWQGEILPTLSYEALREGVEDSLLISTMQILVHKALQAGDAVTVRAGTEARNYLDGILKRANKNFKERYWEKHKDLPVDPMEKAILRDLNNGQSEDYEIFDKIRRGICDRIITLQNALDN